MVPRHRQYIDQRKDGGPWSYSQDTGDGASGYILPQQEETGI